MPEPYGTALATIRDPVEIASGLYVFKQPDISELSYASDAVLCDAEQIVFGIPNIRVGYAIHEGIVTDVARAYDLYRLERVRQLGLLEDPETESENIPMAFKFEHSRLLHSFDVMVCAMLLAWNNREWFEKHPGYRDTLLVAALTHDVLTPAGGDTVKAIDPPMFDEDLLYPNVFERASVRAVCNSYGIDTRLLTQTVQGEEVLGCLLDIADKLAYTARDLYEFAGIGIGDSGWDERAPLRHEIEKCVGHTLGICSLWHEISVNNQGVVCSSPERLGAFLRARALMFRNLYTHPEARYHESLVMRTLVSFLYETGRLTRDALLSMDDIDLSFKIIELIGHDNRLTRGAYRPTYSAYESQAAAERRERELIALGKRFVQTEDVSSSFNSGTHFLVAAQHGTRPFEDACPREAVEIAELGRPIDPIRVYYLEEGEPVLRQLQKEFEAWRIEKCHTEL